MSKNDDETDYDPKLLTMGSTDVIGNNNLKKIYSRIRNPHLSANAPSISNEPLEGIKTYDTYDDIPLEGLHDKLNAALRFKLLKRIDKRLLNDFGNLISRLCYELRMVADDAVSSSPTLDRETDTTLIISHEECINKFLAGFRSLRILMKEYMIDLNDRGYTYPPMQQILINSNKSSCEVSANGYAHVITHTGMLHREVTGVTYSDHHGLLLTYEIKAANNTIHVVNDKIKIAYQSLDATQQYEGRVALRRFTTPGGLREDDGTFKQNYENFGFILTLKNLMTYVKCDLIIIAEATIEMFKHYQHICTENNYIELKLNSTKANKVVNKLLCFYKPEILGNFKIAFTNHSLGLLLCINNKKTPQAKLFGGHILNKQSNYSNVKQVMMAENMLCIFGDTNINQNITNNEIIELKCNHSYDYLYTNIKTSNSANTSLLDKILVNKTYAHIQPKRKNTNIQKEKNTVSKKGRWQY